MALATVKHTVKIDLPAHDSYDYAVYARDIDFASPESSDSAVAQAMVEDYLKRGENCTAANYIRLVRVEVVEV